MNFKTITDLNSCINLNLSRIPKNIDLVVGVPRSGMIAAYLIALYLNLPCVDVDGMLRNDEIVCGNTKRRHSWINVCSDAKNILIVEDSTNTGQSILEIKEKLVGTGYENKVTYLAVYACNPGINQVDYYFEYIEPPRMFEWNYMHHDYLINACFDIDGVLCEDPTAEQNDDGEKYKKFIRNAEPRFIPTKKIGTLVTSRLEKYREDTEWWLNENGIEYDRLIMMQYATKEERIARGNHGEFKGENYKKIKSASLFVESDPMQAEVIAKISGKMVYCVGNQQVYDESIRVKCVQKTKKSIRKIVKSILPDFMIRFFRKTN